MPLPGQAGLVSQRNALPLAPGTYRSADLIAAGSHPKRLRASDVRRVARGILVTDATFNPFDYLERCIAIGTTLRQGHFLSRRSAAWVYGIPCPQPPGGKVDVGSFSPHRAPRKSIIAGHRVKDGTLEWRTTQGIVLPSPADVWCQLAAVLTRSQLVAAGDFLISGQRVLDQIDTRTPALASMEELHRARARHRKTVGAPSRAAAIHLLRSPVDSPRESHLRMVIIGFGLAEPIVNCPVPTVGRLLHADLGYPDLKIAIEYEGAYHFRDVEQGRFDAARRRAMIDAGWTVIQVTDLDIADPTDFLRILCRALHAAQARSRH